MVPINQIYSRLHSQFPNLGEFPNIDTKILSLAVLHLTGFVEESFVSDMSYEQMFPEKNYISEELFSRIVEKLNYLQGIITEEQKKSTDLDTQKLAKFVNSQLGKCSSISSTEAFLGSFDSLFISLRKTMNGLDVVLLDKDCCPIFGSATFEKTNRIKEVAQNEVVKRYLDAICDNGAEIYLNMSEQGISPFGYFTNNFPVASSFERPYRIDESCYEVDCINDKICLLVYRVFINESGHMDLYRMNGGLFLNRPNDLQFTYELKEKIRIELRELNIVKNIARKLTVLERRDQALIKAKAQGWINGYLDENCYLIGTKKQFFDFLSQLGFFTKEERGLFTVDPDKYFTLSKIFKGVSPLIKTKSGAPKKNEE